MTQAEVDRRLLAELEPSTEPIVAPVDLSPLAEADRRPVIGFTVRRRELRMSLRKVAKRCHIHADFLGLMEQHRFIPTADQIQRIAAALSMEPDDVLKEVVI